MKRKQKAKKISRQKLFFLVLAVIFIFLFTKALLIVPLRVAGNATYPFLKKQIVVAEKVSYIFREPEVGDRIFICV